jgi:hypothetical protein
MHRSLIILFAFALSSFVVFSQDTLVIQGHYNGKNLYILNPSSGSDTSFCVKKVMVNNQPTNDEIHSNSFEIDFSQLNLQNGAIVKICISYSKGCKPKIVNPDVLQLISNFAFINAKIDKTSKLIWTVKGELNNSFTIEQFRWNKWMTISEVDIMDTVKKNVYSFEIKPHYGINEFRISHTDEKGNTVYSKLIKYHAPPAVKEIFLTSSKVTDDIVFTGETAYEIFDDKENFISDGYATQFSITDLPKGKYIVNYDNKTETITKK